MSFLLHYLDDFHTLGPPNSQTCQRNLHTCIQQFQDWGIPLHPDKLEGPSTLLTVLGIDLDSLLFQARLPQEKFDRIHTLLVSWSEKHHCTRKELESFFGNLQHVCKVVPSGRTFLRRMINLLSAFHREDHPIRLNTRGGTRHSRPPPGAQWVYFGKQNSQQSAPTARSPPPPT